MPNPNALTCLIAMFGNLALDRLNRRLFQYRLNIEHSARIDGLTGIANRFHFSKAAPVLLELCRRHEPPISVFMIDIDHFKRINDEYGHPEGDEVIRQVADSMGTKLRTTDLPARYGGKEFFVILPETSPRAAAPVAETIRRTSPRQRLPWVTTVQSGSPSVSDWPGMTCCRIKSGLRNSANWRIPGCARQSRGAQTGWLPRLRKPPRWS